MSFIHRLGWSHVIAAMLLLICAFIAAGAIFARFAPQKQDESQCLICQRERDELEICNYKIRDRTTSNEYSAWIDTFVPSHRHVWLVATTMRRDRWFGSKSIGCGGIPALAEIYRSRAALGEQNARALVKLFHREVRRGYRSSGDFDRLSKFADQVATNPQSLLMQAARAK